MRMVGFLIVNFLQNSSHNIITSINHHYSVKLIQFLAVLVLLIAAACISFHSCMNRKIIFDIVTYTRLTVCIDAAPMNVAVLSDSNQIHANQQAVMPIKRSILMLRPTGRQVAMADMEYTRTMSSSSSHSTSPVPASNIMPTSAYVALKELTATRLGIMARNRGGGDHNQRPKQGNTKDDDEDDEKKSGRRRKRGGSSSSSDRNRRGRRSGMGMIWSAGYSSLVAGAGPGSKPPQCISRCGNCRPCIAVRVPVRRRTTPNASEYYPEAWRCKCGGKLYMP